MKDDPAVRSYTTVNQVRHGGRGSRTGHWQLYNPELAMTYNLKIKTRNAAEKFMLLFNYTPGSIRFTARSSIGLLVLATN